MPRPTDYRAALADLRARLEHVQGLSPFEQLRHLWPTIEQLMQTVECLAEAIDRIRDREGQE